MTYVPAKASYLVEQGTVPQNSAHRRNPFSEGRPLIVRQLMYRPRYMDKVLYLVKHEKFT